MITNKQKQKITELSKEGLNIIVWIGWALGNLIIFSSIVFLSYTIKNKGEFIDNILIVIVMLMWVFGQMNLLNDKKEKKK